MRKLMVMVVSMAVVLAFASVSSAQLLKHSPKNAGGKSIYPKAKGLKLPAAPAKTPAVATTAAPKAAALKVSGQVVSVDTMRGVIVVKDSVTGMNKSIPAGTKSLAGLKAGDGVEVALDANNAAAGITKK